MLMIAGALAAIALCFIGVLAMRRSDPPAFDDDGKARLPIAMTAIEAEAYLQRLGYPNTRSGDGGRMVIAQDKFCNTDDDCRARKPKIVFDFTDGLDRPRCISVTHSYTLDWRRIVAKLAGVDGDKLAPYEEGYRKTIRTAIGEMKLVMFSLSHIAIGPGC